MSKKQVYHKNNNKCSAAVKSTVPKKKIDKNTIYAFILLAFFIFWTIGSVFSFINFSKKKESNVVSASADVVDDIYEQKIINEVTFHLMEPMYVQSVEISPLYEDNYYSLNVHFNNIADYQSTRKILFPLSYICDQLIDGHTYFFSFKLDTGYSLSSLPTLFFCEYDYESGDLIDNVYFNIDHIDDFVSVGDYYDIDFVYSSNSVYWVECLLPNQYIPYDDLVFYNVNIFDYSSDYRGYAYTYEELREIYSKAIEDSYQDGVTSSGNYDSGYADGYNQAMDDVSDKVMGFFGFSKWNAKVGQGYDESNSTYMPSFTINPFNFMSYEYGSPSYIDLKQSTFNVFSNSYQSILPYFNSTLTFEAYDLNIDPNYFFLGFESNISGLNGSNIEDNFYVRVYDNLGNFYQGEFVVFTQTYYQIRFDFRDMPDGAYIERFLIDSYVRVFVAPQEGEYLTLIDYGVDYMLGFDDGYELGYDDALRNYQDLINAEYQRGLRDGETIGYNNGYNAGVSAANEYSFMGLIGAVVDVPIRAFTSLFNFEILGINLANFFFALLTVALILAIIKLIL